MWRADSFRSYVQVDECANESSRGRGVGGQPLLEEIQEILQVGNSGWLRFIFLGDVDVMRSSGNLRPVWGIVPTPS